jgi:choline-glycine betaine transporter
MMDKRRNANKIISWIFVGFLFGLLIINAIRKGKQQNRVIEYLFGEVFICSLWMFVAIGFVILFFILVRIISRNK